MGPERRIHRWLAEQARHPQVSPTYPPSAPSTSVRAPSFHSSDETDSQCSTCPPPQRRFDHDGHHYPPQYKQNFKPTNKPKLPSTPLAIPTHPRVQQSHVPVVAPRPVRLGPTAYNAAPVVVPQVPHMRSYSMDDLSNIPTTQGRPGFTQQFQYSSMYPTPSVPVPIPPVAVQGRNSNMKQQRQPPRPQQPQPPPPPPQQPQSYLPPSSFPPSKRARTGSRTGSQGGTPWGTMQQGNQVPPFEVSQMYQMRPQGNRSWAAPDPQMGPPQQYQQQQLPQQYQYHYQNPSYGHSPRVAQRGISGRPTSSRSGSANPNVRNQQLQLQLQQQQQQQRPVAVPMAMTMAKTNTNARSESRTRTKSTHESSKKPVKHTPHHAEYSIQPPMHRENLFKRLINGFTHPIAFRSSHSKSTNATTTGRSSGGPKSILKGRDIRVEYNHHNHNNSMAPRQYTHNRSQSSHR